MQSIQTIFHALLGCLVPSIQPTIHKPAGNHNHCRANCYPIVNIHRCGIRLTLLFTQSQPDWFWAVFPKSHSEIFNLRFEPVNFIFKSLHGIFDRIPCPCPVHFWLVITVCKRQSDFVFCGFVIWVFHHHLKASGSRNGPTPSPNCGCHGCAANSTNSR